MTFPAYRHLLGRPSLSSSDPSGDEAEADAWPLAVGAQVFSEQVSSEQVSSEQVSGEGTAPQPVGLALGLRTADPHVPVELLSVFVDSSRRRQGLAGELLRGFEGAARAAGARQLRTVYMTGKPGIAIFERLIRSHGWSPPEVRMITLKATMEQAVRMPWYRRYRPRSGFEIFSWQDLEPAEMEELRASQERDQWIPEDLVPWNFDRQGFEKLSSVGARLDGQVVGWVVNHCINPETIRFTCSFMRQDLARRGRIVALYSEAIRRLSQTRIRRCVFTTPMHFPEMVSFVERRIAPWGTALEETRGATKDLL